MRRPTRRPLVAPGLPEALDGPVDQRVRLAGLAARDPVARRGRPAREPDRVLAPRRARLPALHPLRAARRRLGRPAAPPSDPHRRRRVPRGAARAHPDPVGAGVLRIWHLLVLQFVIGIFTVFFDVAYQSYLPALDRARALVDGNSKLQLTVSVAQVGGPSIAGGLIAAITAPYAIVVDARASSSRRVFMVRDAPPREAAASATPASRTRRCGRR